MSYSSSHSGGSAASHMPTPSRPIVGPAARDTLSLSLITYLEKMPLPALVLKPVGWEAGKLSHETVVYVNPALTSLSKSAVGLPSLDVEGKPLADLLRVDNPKDMEDWLSFAVQSGASSTKYTTGLVWSTPSTSATAVGVRPETLDIEWSAVQLEDTFVVLTGTVLSGRSPSPPAKPMPRRELSADGAFQQSSPALQTSDSWMRIERVRTDSPFRSEVGRQKRPPLVRSDTCRTDIRALKLFQLSESLVGGGITGELLRNHDWSNTPLGPITSWPQSLVTTLSLVMGSQSPMAICNDAYIPVAGGKHPWLFGKPGPEGWKEIWHNLKPQADICMTGTGTYYDRDLLFMTRKGYPEEGYFNWSYIPIRQEDGSVGGLLNPNFEQSAEVLLERRMKTLRDFSVNAGQAKTMTQLLSIAAEVLTANTRDIAFALLYTGAVDHGEHQEGDGSDSHYYTLTLAETVGISRGHRAAAEQVTIDIDGDFANPAHLWPFQEACRQRGPKETHGQNIVEGIDGRCWGDPSKIVVTCPIIGSDAEEVRGVLVIGVSARRPYDEDYK
ncbi:hypothetical protein HKX48_002189 [Thoreauomyces humboldtii]|nr:hypothetical protein HKX48_002189 [Thoreauomyces humboldtii]